MSTKTTFKRIALVAVAALGLSLVAVAPSQAAITDGVLFPGVTALSTPADATVGIAVTATFNHTGVINQYGANAAYTQAVVVAIPVTSAKTPNAATVAVYSGTAYTATTGTTTTATDSNAANGDTNYNPVAKTIINTALLSGTARINGYFTVAFTPDVAGTYVIAIKSMVDATQLATWTFTAVNPVQKSATAFLNTDSSTASTADASSLVFAAAASVTPKGRLTVRQYSTTDTATLTTTAISKDVVVAISKGLVSKTNDYFAGAKSVTTAAATAATNDYYVFANGEIGTATLTVTVGGVLASTKTITFNGVAKTLTATLTSGQPTFIAPSGTTTVTVTAKDEAGNTATSVPSLTVTSATTTVATATVAGAVVTITGVAAGTSVITIADSGAVATSTTYTVTVAPAASATLPTITFDKLEYMAGELMTITIGAQAADNASFVAFTGLPTVSVNVITTTNPFSGGNTGTVALVGGKATWKAYAPITPGPVVITATSSTGSSATAAAVTATATVISDGVAQAAVDAAAEAIDAANAATDAANAAAEAADAATAAAQDAADAVAALSVSVAAMIDSLKKQITALTNLVIKIQKKVKA